MVIPTNSEKKLPREIIFLFTINQKVTCHPTVTIAVIVVVIIVVIIIVVVVIVASSVTTAVSLLSRCSRLGGCASFDQRGVSGCCLLVPGRQSVAFSTSSSA